MTGCVLIHGFTGSPYEVEPLARHLKEELGWFVICPVLAGHKDDQRDLRDVRWQDWITSASLAVEEALNRCDKVYLIGFSMGGMIAAHLADRYPVDKLVLLSTAVFYANPAKMLWDIVQTFVDMIKSAQPNESWQRYRQKIGGTPTHAVLQFQIMIRRLRPVFSKLDVPTLIIHGGQDMLVHPRSPQYIYDHLPTKHKQLHILPQSKHVICHDCEQDQLFDLVTNFLQQQ